MFELEDVWRRKVVTASGGVEEDSTTAAANVYTVSRDDIATHRWRSLAEILANVPGLYVIDDLVSSSVGVRGVTGGLRAGSRIVRVMIDGVEVSFHPDLSALLGPEFIPVEAVERVEIAKGPLSALYGANAFLATVNVITRTPASGGAGEATLRHFRTNAMNGWGLPGNGASLLVSYAGDRASVLAALSFERTDRSGLKITRTFDAQNPDLPRFRPFFDSSTQRDLAEPLSGYAKVAAHLPFSFELALQGGLQNLDSGGELRPASVLTHQSRQVVSNAWGSLKLERPLGERAKAFASFGLSHGAPTRDNTLFLTDNNNFRFTENFDSTAIEVAAGASFSLLERFSLFGGLDYAVDQQQVLYFTQIFNVPQGIRQPGDQIDNIGPTDIKQISINNFGVYVQGAGAPFSSIPKLNLAANLRLDVPNLFPAQYAWRAAAAYSLSDDVVIKLIGGRAFQTPSGVMLYAVPGMGSTLNVIGNRTQVALTPIAPQVVQSLEAVISARVFKLAAVDAALFFQAVENKIEFFEQGGNFIARNRGSLSVVGAEANVRVALGKLSPYLSVSTQISLADAAEGRPDASFSSAGFPSVVGMAGVNLKWPEIYLRGNLHAKVVGARGANQSNVLLNNLEAYSLPAYFMADLTVATLGLHPLGTSTETTVSVTMRNLFDAHPSEPYFGGFDLPTLGRAWLFEVKQSF